MDNLWMDGASFLSEIIVSLASSLLWAIGAFFVVLFYHKLMAWHYKNKFYRSTRLNIDKKGKFPLRCYIANSGRYDADEKVYLGYPFEYMASATVNTHLEHLTRNTDMKISPCPLKKDEVVRLDKTGDLILLGGPFHNLLTRLFFGLTKENTNVPFYFDTFDGEEATLFYKENNDTDYRTAKPIKDPNGNYYCEDYALILNIRNPYNPDKRVITIMGCRSIGVLGGTNAFTMYNKDIFGDVKYDEYAVIIKCYGEQNNINDDRKIERVSVIKLDSIGVDSLVEIADVC